jgi:hypothetical protein
METKEFYVQLGKLLYAMAMADGEVQDEEIQALYKMVINELSDETVFNQEEVNVFHTEFEFEALLDKNANKHEAFQSFITFFDANHPHFTVEMKKVCLHAVNQIAQSFQGIIAEERDMIEALEQRMKKI